MSVNCKVLKNGVCEITQYYGGNHIGIDLVGKNYTIDNVVAHSSGIVTFVQTGKVNNQGSTGNESYGNCVKIDHGNGFATLYAHLQTVNVVLGQRVVKGELIGTMGNTGNSYGAHLHFEVIKDNIRIDPYEYLNKDFFYKIVEPVEKDNKENQLQVNVIDLRIRKSPSISSEILGVALLNGIYNYYEMIEKEGYTWYKIGDNAWIANTLDWLTIYPKVKDMNIEKLQIEMLKSQIELLERENELLKQTKQDLNVFNAIKAGNYYISLKENEKLYYKKN